MKDKLSKQNTRYKTISTNGYVMIRCIGHPRATKYGSYVFEHILVMEKHLGRYITTEEDVHHINGNKQDNRLENLQLMSHIEHSKHHSNAKPQYGNKHNYNKHKDVSDRQCYECGAKNTYTSKAGGALKTYCIRWYHIPTDKINWYCGKCQRRHYKY
jgi:uncharacterized protein (DUF1330 family)